MPCGIKQMKAVLFNTYKSKCQEITADLIDHSEKQLLRLYVHSPGLYTVNQYATVMPRAMTIPVVFRAQ
jgi:hypothetical protein